ncbi:alpha-(1,3)-fucosyltransferase 7 [Mantella aurantiaca]
MSHLAENSLGTRLPRDPRARLCIERWSHHCCVCDLIGPLVCDLWFGAGQNFLSRCLSGGGSTAMQSKHNDTEMKSTGESCAEPPVCQVMSILTSRDTLSAPAHSNVITVLRMPTKHRLRCWMVLSSIFVLLSLAWNIQNVLFTFSSEQAMTTSSDVTTTVLIWHWPFHNPLNISGDVCFDLYNIKNCRLTDNRDMLDFSDVVVFHHRELNEKGYHMPADSRNKVSRQMWVWATLESPSNTKNLGKWNNTFNWTLTYREDSDIFIPYGHLVPKLHMQFNTSLKMGLLTWAVSNYHHTQERATFFKEFSRYLNVDVYGKASNKSLCSSCLLPTISRYYFYLALENSVHKDYITEKLWRNSFLAGAVPVVLGPPRENYEKFIHTDSFIHISDFSSAKDLATFLESMTIQRYEQYFRWRKEYGIKVYNDWRERFCMICSRYPHLPKVKVYSNLESWFTSNS